MTNQLTSALQLLHTAASGVLATHSEQVPGYPFASILPFALDEQHRPLFLMSALAEHARNVGADGRASLLVAGDGDNVLREARLTVVGDIEPCAPSDALRARYLRYQPDARRYLQLGDFSFFRLLPRQARYIAGFGDMGWIGGDAWQALQTLDPASEEACMLDAAGALPRGVRLLGIDSYGIDIERQGKRERHLFPNGPVAIDTLVQTLGRHLGAL